MKNIKLYEEFFFESEVPAEKKALDLIDRADLGIKNMRLMIQKNPEYNGQNLQLSVPAIESAGNLYRFLVKIPELMSPETSQQLLTLAKLDWKAATLGKILDVYGKILVQLRKECESKLANKE